MQYRSLFSSINAISILLCLKYARKNIGITKHVLYNLISSTFLSFSPCAFTFSFTESTSVIINSLVSVDGVSSDDVGKITCTVRDHLSSSVGQSLTNGTMTTSVTIGLTFPSSITVMTRVSTRLNAADTTTRALFAYLDPAAKGAASIVEGSAWPNATTLEGSRV